MESSIKDDRKRQPDGQGWWVIDDRSEIGYHHLQYSIQSEPLLHEFLHNGERVGIVTRNRYNAKVLNVPTMLIADVDIGDPQFEDGCLTNDETEAIAILSRAISNVSAWTGKTFEPLFWLFRNGSVSKTLKAADLLLYPNVPIVEDLQEALKAKAAIHRINLNQDKDNFVEKLFYGLGFRIYRTAGGLRYICTTHTFTAGRKIEDDLLRYLLSDPRYRQICREQRTFRARLTPKPWRVDYDDAKTCDFIGVRGFDKVLPEFAEIIQYHDLVTGCSEQGALA